MDRITRLMNGVSFHRGLALGALVGAAIAGSTLWTRLREARELPPKAAERPPRKTRDDLPA